jgi:hypothetical protein
MVMVYGKMTLFHRFFLSSQRSTKPNSQHCDALLHKFCGRDIILRTFLYANDAIIFLAPITGDILNLSNIIEGYGEVTGLCTNF